MQDTYIRGSILSMEASTPINKGTISVLIVCNEPSTAPVWGYMIREKKLHAVIETKYNQSL